MARGQNLLDEAISLIAGAVNGPRDHALGDQAAGLSDRLTSQRDKFFFKSLAGVPLANKVKKAAQALSIDFSRTNMDAIEVLITEIEDKADAPGTVLT